MLIREWEVWHTYSTFLGTGAIDLEKLARTLVRTGFARCVSHRDGFTVWDSPAGMAEGRTELELHHRNTAVKATMVKADESMGDLDGFAAEAWFQATRFRFGELRVFHEGSGLPDPYIRAYLGECHLGSDEDHVRVTVYPVVNVYETGVVIVEFRTISPNAEVDLETFISYHVNLFDVPLGKVEVPPGVAKVAARAWERTRTPLPIHRRVGFPLHERLHDQAIDELTRSVESEAFTFELAPLPGSEQEEPGAQLASLFLSLCQSLAFLISEPRSPWSFVLLGNRPLPDMGEYWVGRPHVFLVDFQDQCATARENLDHHRASFGAIMARSILDDQDVASDLLPNDQRIFDDYNLFVDKQAVLLVWSRDGVKRQATWADANRGHLIYEQQATLQTLVTGEMLMRRILADVREIDDVERVMDTRALLLDLEQRVAMASAFGEIRELFREGSERLGLPELRERMDSLLQLQDARARVAERRSNETIAKGLAVIFGFVAVPPFAEQVVGPLWRLLGLATPGTQDATTILMNLVALLLIGGTVGGMMWRFGGGHGSLKSRRRNVT